MTNKTYLFAGASSLIAIEAAKQLQANGHQVIGISTKNENTIYNAFSSKESNKF